MPTIKGVNLRKWLPGADIPDEPRRRGKRAAQVGLSEAAFQQQVITYAKLLGWRVAHFRKVRVQRANGSVYWETPVAADGAGFPDLILVRGSRILAAELKIGKNKPTPEQHQWLLALMACKVAALCWRPEDWEQIKMTLE